MSIMKTAVGLANMLSHVTSAGVPEDRIMWCISKAAWRHLFNAKNTLDVYVWRDELRAGTLLGHPVYCAQGKEPGPRGTMHLVVGQISVTTLVE